VDSLLVPGDIIVMWDGKFFGTYYDLFSAIQDATDRITEESGYTVPQDYHCLEFLRVLKNPDECPEEFRSDEVGFSWRDGIRISFGYPVLNLCSMISAENKRWSYNG
jgi:hypothetical protein